MEMDDNKRRRNMILYVLIAFVVYLVLSTVLFPNIGHTQQITKTDYSTFVKALDKKSVDKVEYNTDDYTIYYTKKGEDENIAYKTTGVPNDAGFTDRVLESGASLESVVPDKNSGLMTYYLLTLILPMAIFFLIGWWLNRRMKKAMGDDGPSMNFGGGGFGGGGLGKSGARVIASKDVGVTFKDVAGQEEAKESLKEVVDFLEKPQRYEEIGAKLPRGALLVGPPGTGKTLLAKAVAGEAGVPFFSISGSEFVEMFVGRGAAKVRDLFKQAKEKAPCIVFIDEIDTIGKKRDGGGFSGNDEREQTLNQLLVEMDGFTNNEGVIVMAATNRADILDNALLRPGRFDRRVYMGLPDIKGREEILKVHARGKPLGDDVDLKSIARGTAGFAGADLENLLNEAAIMATRSKRRFIMQADIDEAILKVVMGPEKKSRVVSERARRLTAYHESGHAIASFFLKNSDPVHYITIIPRGAAGGFTWYRKAEDAENFTSRGEMFDSIVSALGGRIAEQLFLDDISTGASNDIQQATNIARDMVMKYGMSEKLGPISFDDSSHSIFIGRDFGTTKSYSEETAATIDEEVKHLFDQAYAKCEALLREHADLLTGLAEYLLIHETIEGDDFRYYCEHGVMPVHPDDTIEPPAKVIRRMDEAPVAPQPEAEAPAQPETPSAPDADAPNSDPGEQP